MVIVLPDAQDGLPALLEKLSQWDNFKAVFNRRNYTTKRVNLKLPRFTFKGDTVDLTRHLSEMGLGSIFSSDADFSELVEGEQFCVSQLIHQAVIKVIIQSMDELFLGKRGGG